MRATMRCVVLAPLAPLALLATSVGAQQTIEADVHAATSTATTPNAAPVSRPATPARRPDYQTLRFEERWPEPATFGGRGPLDALKHLPLTPGGAAYLTLGGQLRWRGEAVHNFLLGVGDDRRDAFELLRASGSADLHLGAHVRLFGELHDALSVGRELPGGRRPQDDDRWDVQNAFVEATCCGAWHPRVRVGVQELTLGRERLLSAGDWPNVRRSFAGVRLDVSPARDLSVVLFDARPMVMSTDRWNRADTNARLRGVIASRRPSGRTTLEAFALDLDQTRGTLGTLAGAHHRLTIGARAAGTVAQPWLAYEVEGGQQRGRLADARIDAWYVASEITATARGVALTPALSIGYDRASGDRDSTDRATNTFHQLYTGSHGFYGTADIVGRQNAAERRVAVSANVPLLGQLRVSAHDFRRASAQDAAYTKGGTVLAPRSADASLALGREIDVATSRPLGRHLRMLGGYAHFMPGDFLRGAISGAAPSDWVFTSVALTF